MRILAADDTRWQSGHEIRFGSTRILPRKGEGAGLRISGTTQPRANRLAGDSPWKRLDFEFEVAPSLDSVELVCELRATQGEAWFETDSLVLVRLK